MSEDPWKEIARPAAEAGVTALRIDATHPWNFFWGKDGEGRCLLVLRFQKELSKMATRLPKLRGLNVKLLVIAAGPQDAIVLELVDAALRDVFLTLCNDIVNSTRPTTSEADAVEVALRRTWRWHHLLRGGSDARLSPDEQKGLIGELLVLEKHLVPAMGALDAVRAWLGPENAPKDFQIGALCIEAKARRGSATAEIAISSDTQLDTTGVDSLYLHVVNLASAPEGGGGISVADLAERVRDALRHRDPLAIDLFDERLESAGLDPTHDYSDWMWLEGECWVYRVEGSFPRIEANSLMTGVSRVRYSVLLRECEAYRIEPHDLDVAIAGAVGHVE